MKEVVVFKECPACGADIDDVTPEDGGKPYQKCTECSFDSRTLQEMEEHSQRII